MDRPSPDPAAASGADLSGYFDACATSPPSEPVLAAMARAQSLAWANPSSLHGPGLMALESLERSRAQLADDLGCDSDELVFCSGASEAIHLALLGVTANQPPGRLLISAVEHPATLAASEALERRGWQVVRLPVDRTGLLRLDGLEALLAPPTRLVSLIWGQSEVGALQPIRAVGELCRRYGVPLHVDAVQVLGHLPVQIADLPVDLLSCCAHKLQGPRGIGVLVLRNGLELQPLIGGGGQERGRRGGTEAVALAAGFAAAVREACGRLAEAGGCDPLARRRDALLADLLSMPGLQLSGPDPRTCPQRLPHHLSLLITDDQGTPLPGRALVRALARRGIAASSGSACSASHGGGASPVLLAMGYSPAEASAGLRLSLGPWLRPQDLKALPQALAAARQDLITAAASGP